jgi:macrolide-specific efflux system membrane fusion protein
MTAKKKRTGIYWIALLVALVAGAGFFEWKKNSKQRVSFRSFKVSREDMAIAVVTTGTVAPENRLNIQAPIAGRAEQVMVDQGDSVKKGQVLIWMSSTERAAVLDGARSDGADELKKWEELYRPTPVIAPVSGMIIQRNIQPGQTFGTTDAILVMSDHLIVQAQVDETDIAQLHLNQTGTIVLDAYPGNSVAGHVERIAFDAKTVANVTTYEVDLLPEKVPDFMRSGMTANVTFPIGSKKDTLCVPADSIKTKDGRPYVLVPGPHGEPVNRDVTLGIADGKRVEITAGLAEGETVMEPEFKLNGPKNNGTNAFSGMGGGHR